MYHFNLVDKLRETFIGKTQEELEKQRAFVSPGFHLGGDGGGGIHPPLPESRSPLEIWLAIFFQRIIGGNRYRTENQHK